jgi:hypothetical protein
MHCGTKSRYSGDKNGSLNSRTKDRKVIEHGKSLEKENEWRNETTKDSQGRKQSMSGEALDGPDQGRKWRETFGYTEQRIRFADKEHDAVITDMQGVFLEKGANPKAKTTPWDKGMAHDKATGDYITHWRGDGSEWEKPEFI